MLVHEASSLRFYDTTGPCSLSHIHAPTPTHSVSFGPHPPPRILFVPVAVPAIVCLDALMLVTSVAPILMPKLATNFSSFMSNYNFSRLFIQCEAEGGS